MADKPPFSEFEFKWPNFDQNFWDKFKVPGNSQPTRYVQPTLVARDAAASPKLVWISRELKGEAKTGSKSGDR